MAENNSSAPLKTAEGAATLWCVHVTGADDVHPMPSREVALEEANALNTSICRIKRQDIDPVLIAVVAEWPHSADSHAAGLMIRDECLRMRGDQALAAQAAPAAVAVPEITDAMVDAYLAEQRRTVEEADRFGRSNIGGLHTNTVRDACRNGLRAALATPALPATEDSSAGDLAEVQASTLQEIAIEELYQLGYTFKDGRLIPPDHVGELMSVVQGSACGCQYGTCETKANRACRMTAEIREQAQAEVQAAPVAAKFFSFDPADDLVFHETEDDARSAAQRAIDLYRDEAADGWSEEVERVCWGLVIQQSAENVLPDNFPPNAFAAGAAGSLPSVDYVLTPLYTAPQAQPAFQQRVQPWMMECFGPEISADRIERNHRFLEEALELVQATGCTKYEAFKLVNYVFKRPVGKPAQEVGGVMVTLAAHCLANSLDMQACAETELERIWTKVPEIRAKQAAKPKHSPLPMAQDADPLDEISEALHDYHYALDTRQHGGVAAGTAINAIEAVLDMHWQQSQETNRRAAMAAAQEGGNAAKGA